jgi:putative endonuclease
MALNQSGGADRAVRQARYRAGLLAELLAMVLLWLKGYRVLAWRARTRHGEIDLIAQRGRHLAFIEVKQRRDAYDFADAVTARQMQRLERAADTWIGRHRLRPDIEITMDTIFCAPFQWPRHQRNFLARCVCG